VHGCIYYANQSAAITRFFLNFIHCCDKYFPSNSIQARVLYLWNSLVGLYEENCHNLLNFQPSKLIDYAHRCWRQLNAYADYVNVHANLTKIRQLKIVFECEFAVLIKK